MSVWIEKTLVPQINKIQSDHSALRQELESQFAEQGKFAHQIYSKLGHFVQLKFKEYEMNQQKCLDPINLDKKLPRNSP